MVYTITSLKTLKSFIFDNCYDSSLDSSSDQSTICTIFIFIMPFNGIAFNRVAPNGIVFKKAALKKFV